MILSFRPNYLLLLLTKIKPNKYHILNLVSRKYLIFLEKPLHLNLFFSSLWSVLSNLSNDPVGIKFQWRKSNTERVFHQALGVNERFRVCIS
jgi:hypothetical protein